MQIYQKGAGAAEFGFLLLKNVTAKNCEPCITHTSI
jgi:hypothetical protein